MWNTKDNLRKIGSRLGEVIEIDLASDPNGAWKKFVRIHVDIPLGKPLIPGLFLPHPNNIDSWIGLKYEKIVDVCYKCGMVGHEERSCTGTLFQICNPNGARFKAVEPWLLPEYKNLPLGIFKQPDSDTNVTIDSSGQSLENISSSVRVGTLKRASPMSYNMHQDHCTSPLPSQNTWHSHDILTSTTLTGTTCTTPVTSIQAELESLKKTGPPPRISH